MLTAHEFRSDQLAATNHALAYGAWLATAEMKPAYRWHRRMLQLLGWRTPASAGFSRRRRISRRCRRFWPYIRTHASCRRIAIR